MDSLGSAQYALVTTYRRDGRAVPTPLWVVRDGDAIAVWTPTTAGKKAVIALDQLPRRLPVEVGLQHQAERVARLRFHANRLR